MTTRFLSFLVSCLSWHSANLPDFSSKYPHLYIHNFQGMYPPQEPVTSDIGGLGWQPIPVHTLPRSKDLVVVSDHNCPRWRQIWKQKLKELVSTTEKPSTTGPLVSHCLLRLGAHCAHLSASSRVCSHPCSWESG